MLLFKISIFISVLLFCNAENHDSAQNLTRDKNETSPVILVENTFETAHKIHRPDIEFHTSHKISNLPKAQYLKIRNEDEDTSSSLMQLQQTQNLLSTKERPELNPILSALINEDVMKSIEAKRAIEQEQLDAVLDEARGSVTTEGLTLILTTAKPPTEDVSLEDDINVGLVDQPINLDAAGSENNQKSRIQIKKGPNGMDYEYEYVYYYYDDDEAAGGKKQLEAESSLVEESSKKGSQPQERGKSRYTNIERSTTSAPDNVLVSGKAKGRANSQALSEDVDEGRLPVITRFPSRGKNIEVQPTVSLEGLENTASASNEKSKKISVKRPSLELVDSETFNTDEKQVKGSPRNGDSEKPVPVTAIETSRSEEVEQAKTEEVLEEDEVPVADEVDQTTPLMEKAALDLYAILANENLEMDMTTDLDKELTTDLPDTTESDGDDLTTIEEEAETVIPTTSSTTTTTTTTEVPTTTTTTTTSTTTTTTAAPASLFGAGRRGLATAGRNRFRLKSGATSATTTSTTEVPPPAVPALESENSTGLKGRNRFHRPSFGNRNRAAAAAPSPVSIPVEEEVVTKEEEKPVASSPPLRGRTRNRFNARGQASTTTTTAEPNQEHEQNDEENQLSSTTARTLRGRPTLNLRGRSRIGSRPTAPTPAPAVEEDAAAAAPAAQSETTEEKPSLSSLPTRPSRFNLNRVGGGSAAGGNRLLPRARLNTLRTTSTTPAGAEMTDDGSNDVKEESDDENSAVAKSDSEATTAVSAVGGLNRLKTRPRLQLQAKTDNRPKVSPIPARKVNPLLARRKLALGPSTTEAVAAVEDHSDEGDENTPSSSDVSDKKEAATEEATSDDNTEFPETTTKQARGLGLLAQRRRLPIRKPGTLL